MIAPEAGATAIDYPQALDVIAVAAGAVMGAVIGQRQKLDIMGVVVLALVSGVGGGILRDLILQQGPPLAFQVPVYLLAILVGAIIGMFFAGAAERLWPLLLLIDSVALGLFAVVGAQMTLSAGLGPLSAMAIGTIASVGGWLLRDIMIGRLPPALLVPGELYAVAALAGCILFVTLAYATPLPAIVDWSAAIGLTFAIRWLSRLHGITTIVPPDLTPRAMRDHAEASDGTVPIED